MSKKLPIAIVIPHAGLAMPPELRDRIALTEAQIFNEADAYSDMLYDFREHVLHWEVFPYARSIIDVNRPHVTAGEILEGDGIIKRKTSYGASVFFDQQAPDEALEQHLITSYWQTWHDTMSRIADDDTVKLVLDCHSMAAIGPSHYGDPAQIRPRISASNYGLNDGHARSNDVPITASPELTRFAAKAFGNALADIVDIAPTSKAYDINTPFFGGYNIWKHGGQKQPWVMVELSRATYIGEQTGDTPVSAPKIEKIALIRKRLWQAIIEIVNQL